MEFLKNKIIISEIRVAIFVPIGCGSPVHQNRPFHGLAYNVDCDSTYRFDTGKVMTCRSGQCIYLPKGSNYTVDRTKADKNSKKGVYAINFLTLNDVEEKESFKVCIKNKNEFLALFMKAETSWRKRNNGFEEGCFSNLYEIIRILKKESAAYQSTGKALILLKPALKYINENYTKGNIPLAFLANLCNISEPYLRRLFNKAFSESPSVYMRNMRIKYAEELLKSRECPISTIATLAGFNDIAYFSREFKKVTGVSPKSYISL